MKNRLRIVDCWSDEGPSLDRVLDVLGIEYRAGPKNHLSWGFGRPYDISYDDRQALAVYVAVLRLFGTDPDERRSEPGWTRAEWHRLKSLIRVPAPSTDWEEPDGFPPFLAE